VKVNGRWAYLYRAVDSRGRTVDFIFLLVTAKLHTGFWVKLNNEEVADPAIHQHG
jgi:IS6 family transposase